MNSYKCSNGDRVIQSVIDRNIRKEKEIKVNNCHSRPVSELSGRCDDIIDISHIISVKYAKETSRTELCWSQTNLRFLTRKEHQMHDNLTNQERELIYKQWNGL